ncbi:MAG: putative transcriptional regulator [Loktanella salsilacus]|jgi:predicted transcriptional regulator|uniref:MucR family transcriptional regulator n=1 Tax=Loktanella salsilacus TaxID=195913 RepID=UPI003989C390
MSNYSMKNVLNEDAIATIVAGFASRSDVSIDDIITLVARLQAGPAEGAKALSSKMLAIPAVPAEQAMTQDTIYCLCCGKGFKMLKRHIGAEHGLSEEEYRVMFNLNADVPLVAPSYSKRKADYAKQSGLGTYSRETSDKNAEIN